jgi:ribonuclease P protein component
MPRVDWIRGELLWVRPGREAQGAVCVVRKALGKAVVRNKMKRRLRHLCREFGPVAGSVVILVRAPAVRSTYAALGRELSVLLGRLVAAGPERPATP